ncbi:MAG: fibronectin type III domain-containing protein [Eubacterium sp.]|nr:fibronectin type III domain-containing protein [Eubacterium sp.]
MFSGNMKRVCAVLLMALLFLVMIPASVFAAGDKEPRYTIKAADVENGSIAFVDGNNLVKELQFAPYERVDIEVTPEQGYELTQIDAIDKNKNTYSVSESGGRYYIAVKPDSDLTVRAVFGEHIQHKMKPHAYLAPTCETAGNIEYWYCTVCKSFFGDEEGQKEIGQRSDIILPATGHSWGAWTVVKKPTATTPGEKRRVCKNDRSHFETEEIPATGKKEEPKPTPEPEKKTKSSAKAVLTAKATAAASTALTFSWNKIKDADRYVIYFSKCNNGDHKYAPKKIKTVKAGVRKYTVRKLETGMCYKYRVIAQKKVKGKYKNIAKSSLNHTITGNESTAYTVPKSLKLNKSRMTLKRNKTGKLEGAIALYNGNKELLSHAPALRYTSSNTSVASVSKSGKIRAKGRGTCTIYVQTINGLSRKCKVTVK